MFSFSPINFFVRGFLGTAAPRVLKFCKKNIGYDLLNCARENQDPIVYHSIYLSIFLFLQTKVLSQIS